MKRTLRCAVFTLAMSPSIRAQERFDLQTFRTVTNARDDYFTAQSGRILPRYGWSTSLIFDYANDPVKLANPARLHPTYAGPYDGNVLRSQTRLHATGAFSVTHWLQLGLHLPLVVQQHGDSFTGLASPRAVDGSAGIGSIRLVPQVQLYRTDNAASAQQFSVGLVFDCGLPTGSLTRYQGGVTRLEPRVAAEWRSNLGFRLAGNLGFAWRATHAVIGDERVGNNLAWAAALSAPVLSERAELLAEAFGDLGTEVLLGGKVRWRRLSFVAAMGPGFAHGSFAPDYRAVVGIGYWHAAAERRDSDGDGLGDEVDRCPAEPEDVDGYQDEDGCPDPDNDHDRIPDANDRCPTVPEDHDGTLDDDGCPDPDNDGDGIVDAQDACPSVAEDRDGFEDGDGCPEADNDHDGITDANDRCPTDPEDMDGDEDTDGCPDIAVTVRIDTVVFFETNSSVIPNTAQIELDRVAQTLLAMPDELHVWIEGHADDRGTAEANKELGLKRAEAVRHYLTTQGVPPQRISARTYGSDIELKIGRNDPDRQGNRRVEFKVGAKSFANESAASEKDGRR